MPSVSSNSETGFVFNGTTGQALYIYPNVLLADPNRAIDARNPYRSKVYNYGVVVGGAYSLDAEDDALDLLFNAAGAQMNGQLNWQAATTTNNAIVNEGSISSNVNTVTLVNSYGSFLTNLGSITSSSASAIYLTVTNAITLTNAGVIIGGVNGLTANSLGSAILTNSGLIEGRDHAVNDVGSGDMTIRNTGRMDGDVLLGSGKDLLINSGQIYGNATFGSGQDTFRNSGLLDGNLTFGGSYAAVNRGTITGDVTLGAGGGTFDGRKGSVDGTITGGAGIDTITAGNDGETIFGGGGRDVLRGGLGADTFLIKSVGDADTIQRFGVANDTIELSKSGFSRLTVGDSPTFAVASAAVSPTDYLFYNAASGVLYYDADGSGSKAAYAIATLDKGLQLTASNFNVV